MTNVNNNEYQEVLAFILNKHIKPKVLAVRTQFKLADIELHLKKLQEVMKLIRYIESTFNDDAAIIRLLAPNELKEVIRLVNEGLKFGHQLANDAGVIDALDENFGIIMDGLQARYLPDADKAIFRDIVAPNPDMELVTMVLRVKAWHERGTQVSNIDVLLSDIETSLQDILTKKLSGAIAKANPKSKTIRRWFKSLGQIATGTALTIKDVGLAVELIKPPTPAELQIFGTVASVATGIGTVLGSIGDLK